MIPVIPTLLEGGTDLKIRQSTAYMEMQDDDEFFINLQTNSVYYIALPAPADKEFQDNFPSGGSLDNYQNIIKLNEAFLILTNQEKDQKNFIVFFTSRLLKKN
jgi:hypothetical protein